MVLVNKVNINNIKQFFFVPIWLYSNRAYSLAISAMHFIISLFKILLRVFSKAIGQ